MSPTTLQTKSVDGCISGDITNQTDVTAPVHDPVDSEDEDFGHFGYQPLAQNPGDAILSSDSSTDNSDEEMEVGEAVTNQINNGGGVVAPAAGLISDQQCDQVIMGVLGSFDSVPCGGTGDASIYAAPVPDTTQAEVWNAARSEPAVSIELPKDKQDAIRACMANFQLPKSQIPDWAGMIPEAEWKANLLKKLGKDT